MVGGLFLSPALSLGSGFPSPPLPSLSSFLCLFFSLSFYSLFDASFVFCFSYIIMMYVSYACYIFFTAYCGLITASIQLLSPCLNQLPSLGVLYIVFSRRVCREYTGQHSGSSFARYKKIIIVFIQSLIAKVKKNFSIDSCCNLIQKMRKQKYGITFSD